jgi:hypothetical protein
MKVDIAKDMQLSTSRTVGPKRRQTCFFVICWQFR